MTPPVTFHSFSFVSFHFSLNQNLQRAPIDILDLLSAHIWDHQICCEWSLKPVADPSHGGSSDGVEIGKIQRKKTKIFCHGEPPESITVLNPIPGPERIILDILGQSYVRVCTTLAVTSAWSYLELNKEI